MDDFDGLRIETVHVYAEPVGMRARHIERFDAAVSAEIMLGNPGIKRVGRNRVVTLQQAEVTSGNKQMQESTHTTNAAIASGCLNRSRRVDLESDSTAMTTAIVRGHADSFFQTAM